MTSKIWHRRKISLLLAILALSWISQTLARSFRPIQFDIKDALSFSRLNQSLTSLSRSKSVFLDSLPFNLSKVAFEKFRSTRQVRAVEGSPTHVRKGSGAILLGIMPFNLSEVRRKMWNISSKAKAELDMLPNVLLTSETLKGIMPNNTTLLPFFLRADEPTARTWHAVRNLANSTLARGIRRNIPPRAIWNRILFRSKSKNSTLEDNLKTDILEKDSQSNRESLSRISLFKLFPDAGDWIPSVDVPSMLYDKVKDTILSMTDVYNDVINSESPAVAAANVLVSATRRFSSDIVVAVRDCYSFATDARLLVAQRTLTEALDLRRNGVPIPLNVNYSDGNPAQESSQHEERTYHNISEIIENLVEFAMAYDDLTNASWNLVSHSQGVEIWRIDRPPRPHGGVSNWPSFRFATRLDAPPDRVLPLLFDSSKAHAVNRHSLGRSDIEIIDQSTKIVWNRIADVTGVRRPHDFSTLMHIHRPRNSSDIMVVSVAMDHPDIPVSNNFTRSKIIFGFTRLRGINTRNSSMDGNAEDGDSVSRDSSMCNDFDATELVSVSHVQFEGFHPFIISRSSSIGIRNFVDQLKWAISDQL